MQCPLCNKEIGDAYASPSFAIRNHMITDHIESADQNVTIPEITCSCGQTFRGPTSWCRHIVALTSEGVTLHGAIDALGQKALASQRTRKTHDKAKLHEILGSHQNGMVPAEPVRGVVNDTEGHSDEAPSVSTGDSEDGR